MRRIFVAAVLLALACSFAPTQAKAIDCNAYDIHDCMTNGEVSNGCINECKRECRGVLIGDASGLSKDNPVKYCSFCTAIAVKKEAFDVALDIISFGAVTLLDMAPVIARCADLGSQALAEAACTQGPLKCCIYAEESPKITVGDGVCKNEREKCDSGDVWYSCCLCRKGDVLKKVSNERDTHDSCAQKCQAEGMTIDSSFGAGNLPKSASANAPTPAALASVNAMCFTRAECATPEYGGSTDAFREGHGCPSGKGRCIAPEPQIPLSIPLGSVGTVQGLRGYIASAFQYGVSVVAIFAAVMFVYGGFRYIFGSAFGDIKRGKEIMIDASVGMLLVLGSYTILWTINPATLELKRLEVFMINKQVDVSSKWCTDLKKITGKDDLKFAEAGGSSPTEASFITSADDTRCGVEYYPEGLTNRCFGRSCSQLGKEFGCADCSKGSFEGCSEGGKGFGCIKAQWLGSVTWGGTEKPLEIVPFAVCGHAHGAATFDTVKTNMFKVAANVDLSIGSAKEMVMKSGAVSYTIKFSPEALNDAKAACKKNGSEFGGVILGLKYQGMGWAGPALATPVGTAVETFSPGTLTKGGYALITQANCGNSGRFSGYADLDGGYQDAFWCGDKFKALDDSKKLEDPKNFWSEQALTSAIDGTRPILCDINLMNANAPDEPTKAFYGTECEGGTAP